MKLRYYLRGLGVGILVTAVIMGIASWGRRETLSDAQIRERALKMGMVDGNSSVLSDLQSGVNPAGNAKPTESTSPTKPAESTSPTKSEESTSPTKESTSPTKPAESTSPTKPTESTSPTKPTESTSPTKESTSPTKPSQPTVTIVIKGGSGSEVVSRILAEAGLVSDAKAYDQYLCDNGYSKGLRAGTYEIPEGASEEEIANIIATKR